MRGGGVQYTGCYSGIPIFFPRNPRGNRGLRVLVPFGNAILDSQRNEYVRLRASDSLRCIRGRPAIGGIEETGAQDQTPRPALPNPVAAPDAAGAGGISG